MHNSDVKKYVSFRDNTPGVNSKTVTVPGDVTSPWTLFYLTIHYTSTAQTGNRLITIQVLDENSQEMLAVHSRANQQPSETVLYTAFGGSYKLAAGSIPPGLDDVIEVALPNDLLILPNHSLVISDISDRDSGDSFIMSGVGAVLR